MTPQTRWPSYDLIFFDCDSTLSTIEGIDELARLKGKELRVGVLTHKAMNGELDLSQVYGKRLQAIRPTRGQLKAIEDLYMQTIVPDVQAVFDALRFLNKTVFIISGGLAEPVRGFGKRLGVPLENIRAVELEYDELSGEWWRYDEPQTRNAQQFMDHDNGPLTVSSGKPQTILDLTSKRAGRRLMVGDGSSDLATRSVVDLFVGFGGVVKRETVLQGSDAFVHTPSIAPVLPLAAGPAGYQRVLGTPHQAVFDRGIRLALEGGLTFRTDDFRAAFTTAFRTSP
ncbi:MAG: HAD-IB family phosphatase [Chloroflexi bacterium]|nr:MAG: phosphoserine phosphatase [Chloroflexi bacterium OLB13]MBC6956050.1 haloacid dehalogenase [Chloroflexota bacterium]MBV6437339.1 hypothetical protein [Anaerolineae bacterium]MDL1915563.1 haloacid dehalogenase [Anaerolineae bacterium CFX4]MCC6565386.1 HAD-IB family phosphatase [Chloroflexota bacterium]